MLKYIVFYTKNRKILKNLKKSKNEILTKSFKGTTKEGKAS